MYSMVKKEICNGVNFTCIPDRKFKTAIMSFSIFTPLSEEYVSKNAIIPSLLAHSCKKYPSLLQVSKKLEELYGASISPSVSKLGDSQVLMLTAQSVSNSYVDDEKDNVLETAKLLCDMIFEPNIENEKFLDENVNQEKRQLIEDIKSEMNDKKLYARRKCEEIMCKDEKYGIHPLGTIEEAKILDCAELYDNWKRLLNCAHIEIKMIGSCAYEPVLREFESRFEKLNRTNVISCSDEIIKKSESITEVTEKMDVVQCKLVMGFRTEIAKPHKDVDAVRVMNALFGGMPQSKLFANVREKLSLCYYCLSKYNAQKGMIFIESGVEKSNIVKAKEEILNQLQDVRIGNFSDDELEETKLFVIQSIEKTKDSLSALNSWYNAQTFDEIKRTPDEVLKSISEVTREKVINVAQKLTLDTVYMLTSKE